MRIKAPSVYLYQTVAFSLWLLKLQYFACLGLVLHIHCNPCKNSISFLCIHFNQHNNSRYISAPLNTEMAWKEKQKHELDLGLPLVHVPGFSVECLPVQAKFITQGGGGRKRENSESFSCRILAWFYRHSPAALSLPSQARACNKVTPITSAWHI